MKITTRKTKPDLDQSIEELVIEGKCYWKDGQLYQNPNYSPLFRYKKR